MPEGNSVADSAISRLLHYEALDNLPFSHILAVAKWLEAHAKKIHETAPKPLSP